MNELTKDEFMVSYIGKHDSRDNEKLKQQILKWKEKAEKYEMVESLFAELEIPTPYDLWLANSKQWKEDAEQWKIYLDGGLNNLFDMHERLKKQIEFTKKLSYEEDGHTKRVLALLQKILEGEK